jgi:hypothetical protein
MRITGSIVIVIFICTLRAHGQLTKEMPLKPIYKNGGKYFYGTQRMNSVYALQIPLQSLNDSEINLRYKKFKTFQALRGVAYIPALIYLFTNANFGGRRPTRGISSETFLLFVVGGVAADITLNALSHHQMAKAIDIYNVKISDKSSLGLSFNRLLNQNYPGISYQFKF